MKRFINASIVVVLSGIIAMGVYIIYSKRFAGDTVVERKLEPLLATYSRDGKPVSVVQPGIKHLVIKWNNPTGDKYLEQLHKNWSAAEPLLLTVELWPDGIKKLMHKANILASIDAGDFDAKIKGLAAVLKDAKQPVLLRLNPEMEVYVNRYPWQMQSADLYRKSFRHFSEVIKSVSPNVQMVWAPAGYPGTEEFWPGAKWVDLVSVTLKSSSEKMSDRYPPQKTLKDHIFRKLHRVRFFDKPVLLMGSERMQANAFEKSAFDSAVAYLQQNSVLEYMDVNAADKVPSPEILRKDSALQIGIFDPRKRVVDSISVTTEHIFVNIRLLKKGLFKQKFDSIILRNHDAIVTMEPWKDKELAKDPQLMENILSGRYDSLMNELFAVIGHCNRKVYLRWLHEMEIPITRYPWQSQDPLQYIKSYRYFVNFIRSKKPVNVSFVWGPAGDRGSMEFWPGSDVVDYMSIAIYGLPDKNITDHNKQESFGSIFHKKYVRIWFGHKPLFITEFGVKGPADYKMKWLEEAAKTIEENKEITGVSYFNDADEPKAWGDIEAPDWSVNTVLYNDFISRLVTAYKK